MNAYSPRDLAHRWQCSERHVRNLINRGELRAFHLGGKLVRVRHEDVEQFECQSSELSGFVESGPSSGTKMESVIDSRSASPRNPLVLTFSEPSRSSKRNTTHTAGQR